MIKSFGLFLILEKFINESILHYLPNFIDVLKMMSSPIAKDLLELEGSDLKISTNYIGSGEDDSVSFIPDNKSDDVKILFKVIRSIGFVNIDQNGLKIQLPDIGEMVYFVKILDDSWYEKIGGTSHYFRGSSFINYRSVSGIDFVFSQAYRRDLSLCRTSEVFTKSKPQQVKVGRLAKKLLSLVDKKYKDSDVENFVNEFKSRIEISKNAFRNFQLVSGDDIKYWYLESNYCDSFRGSLHSSCMRYDSCQEYFDIYIKNPGVCRLLINMSDFNPSKISGRALVWKLENGDTYMDRVYYSNQHDVDVFNEYARSMGWVYIDHRGRFTLKGDLYIKLISVQLEKYKFDLYPYLDSIPFLGTNGVLSSDQSYSLDKELTSTDGSYSTGCEYCDGEGSIECEECGGHGNVRCEECVRGIVRCSDCDGGGKEDCSDCAGVGKDSDGNDCSKCYGGLVDCSDCGGAGTVDCSDCAGSGETSCSGCGGEGTIDCTDCS